MEADIKNSLESLFEYEASLTGYYYLSPEMIERKARDWLKYSIDYCEGLDTSKYQTDSWNTFKTAIETAKSVYSNESATDAVYKNARNALETAKSKLLFVDSTKPQNPMEFRTLSAAEVKEISVSDISGSALNADGFNLTVNENSTVKAFIWSNMGGMVPLGK